jgi:hypothetical protein
VHEQSDEQTQDYRVRIGAQLFDPRDVASRFLERSAAAKQRQTATAAAAGLPAAPVDVEARIVQFHQAPSEPDVARLRAAYGLRLDQYIPNLAFLERLAPPTIDSVRDDFLVRECIALDPALKLAPWIHGGAGQPPDDVSNDFEATLFDDADPTVAVSALAAVGAHDIQVFDDRDIGGRASLYFVLDEVDHLSQVADIEEIMWIELVLPITVTSVATAILQSGSATNNSIWDHGLHGEGQIIDVMDNGGPDINHCFFADSAPNIPGQNHRKVVNLRGTRLVYIPASVVDPAERQAWAHHASFVCGIAVGDELNNLGGHPERGGAWAARLTFGNHNDLTPIPANPPQPARPALVSLFNQLRAAASDGAFIHSFSWIFTPFIPLAGIYDRKALDVDDFSWQREEHLVVCAAANSVGVTGPLPSFNPSPGIAKNALCVAASDDHGNHGSGVAGPTAGGRRKPDLVAVGRPITSAFPPGGSCGFGGSQLAQTSWATPHAAAAATLVRQYFTEGWYPVGRKVGAPLAFIPTGALLKAVLLNSTVDLTGVPGYPSDLEGWGLIQLDRTLHFAGDLRKLAVWDVRHAVGLTPGYTGVDMRTHELVVLDGAEQLKVTLVWTEPAPALPILEQPDFTAVTLVNDLDLLVTAPDGTQYVGNDFTNGLSTPNGSRDDRLNNVEMVVVDNPLAGKWILEVHGVVQQAHEPDKRIRRAVAGQGYALVATGSLKPPPLVELF